MNKVVEYVKKFETEYRSNYYSQLQEYQKQINLAKLETDFIREIIEQNPKSGKVFFGLHPLSFYKDLKRNILYSTWSKNGRLSEQISKHIIYYDIDKFSIDLNKPNTRIYNTTREKLIKAINIVLIGLVLLILLLILREFSNIRDRNIT
jgi:hypothetical protein